MPTVKSHELTHEEKLLNTKMLMVEIVFTLIEKYDYITADIQIALRLLGQMVEDAAESFESELREEQNKLFQELLEETRPIFLKCLERKKQRDEANNRHTDN